MTAWNAWRNCAQKPPSTCNLPRRRRSRCSALFSAGVKTFTRGGSRAGRRGRRDTPACANEWSRGICEKPRIRCADCSHQRFLPVTDDAIRWHLSGHDDAGQPFVAGVYLMLLDETCFFLAADFDKTGWREDATAFAAMCRQLELPAAIERSRSGNGAHVWLFFEEAIPAALARRLGAHILTETMERRPEVGLDSYDRFFPNQDTLPRGGFGNLIALPLQKQARERGNSVFLDDGLIPYPDQWAFLSTVPRISRSRVDRARRRAHRADCGRAVSTHGRRGGGAVDGLALASSETARGGRNRANGLLDVALIQSLGRKGVVDDRVADYGHLIVTSAIICRRSASNRWRVARRSFRGRPVSDRRS